MNLENADWKSVSHWTATETQKLNTGSARKFHRNHCLFKVDMVLRNRPRTDIVQGLGQIR